MKAFGFVLAAVAAFVLGSAPLAARAAPPPSGKTDAKTLESQHAEGMKDAPAVIQSTGITCDMSDARLIGTFNMKDGDKQVPAKGYEVACKQGLGYVLFAKPGKPQAIDCLSAKATPYACQLPGNATQTFAGYLGGAAHPCDVSDSRGIGSDSSGKAYFEIACRNAPGYVLELQPGVAPHLIDCAQAGGGIACKLTTKEQITAYIGQLAAKSGRQCQVSDARIVGQDSTGAMAYEVGCGSQPGFMFMADKSGNVLRTIDCASAANMAGGCTLTSPELAKAAGKARYQQLAQAAGYNCAISNFRVIGTDTATHRDAVELACANRPDGAVVMFGAQPAQTTIYDCVQAGQVKQSCTLSNPAVLYPKYTAALAKHQRTCQVTDARWAGTNTVSKTVLIETACAGGGPGWIVELNRNNIVTSGSPMSCGGQAQRQGFDCELPENQKH